MSKDTILEIDRNRLDDIACEHPRKMREWGDKLADARRDLALAHNETKLMKSKLSKMMRESPPRYGLAEKPTEAAIEACIQTHKEYQSAILDEIEKEYSVETLQSMVDALKDMGREIDVLARLHGQQYWSKGSYQAGARETMNAAERNEIMAKTGKKKQK